MSTRKYTTNLMLENLFYVIPAAAGNTHTLLESVINPTVPVVKRDCGTGLGLPVDKRALTQTDMWQYVISAPGYGILFPSTSSEALLGVGNAYHQAHPNQYYIRHTSYCAADGGICALCALANLRISTSGPYPTEDLNTIADSILSDGEYTLRSSLGQVRPFMSPSEPALLNWMSDTYSGGLLGISSIERMPIPLKNSYFPKVIPPVILSRAVQEMLQNTSVPEDYIDFFTRITNPLEQAVFVILMYGLYGADAANSPPETFPEATPYAYA